MIICWYFNYYLNVVVKIVPKGEHGPEKKLSHLLRGVGCTSVVTEQASHDTSLTQPSCHTKTLGAQGISHCDLVSSDERDVVKDFLYIYLYIIKGEMK